MRKVLRKSFFEQPTLTVAQKLIGKYLVREIGSKMIALKVTEVEAYDGPYDRASHAVFQRAGEYRAIQTLRNAPMFGPAGRFYVYFVYGMHWMLNVVSGEYGYPAAILIRAAGGINGPARLTKFLKIGKKYNTKIAQPADALWFEDRGETIKRGEIKMTPRIGVAYAGPVWSKKPYRFVLVEKENSPRKGELETK